MIFFICYVVFFLSTFVEGNYNCSYFFDYSPCISDPCQNVAKEGTSVCRYRCTPNPVELLLNYYCDCAAGSYGSVCLFPCERDYYGKNNNCYPCPDGHYTTDTGNSRCKKCKEGTIKNPLYVSPFFTAEPCVECPPGNCTDDTQKSCLNCTEGEVCRGFCSDSYKPGVGYFVQDYREHVSCPLGHYCSNDNQTSPTPCPKGKYCPFEGMSSLVGFDCPEGKYCPSEGIIQPVECSIGGHCPNGSIDQKCGKGFFCQNFTVRSECPEGYFCPGEYSEIVECNTQFQICKNGSIVPIWKEITSSITSQSMNDVVTKWIFVMMCILCVWC